MSTESNGYTFRLDAGGERVQAVFEQSLRRWLARQVSDDLTLNSSSHSIRGKGAAFGVWDSFEDGDTILKELVWRYPESPLGATFWKHTCSLALLPESQIIDVTSEVLGSTHEATVRNWPNPPLIADLCRDLKPEAIGATWSLEIAQVSVSAVPQFVDRILMNDSRRFPILVVSEPREQRVGAPRELLVERFLLAAKVYFLQGEEAREELNACISTQDLACPLNAARIYMPFLKGRPSVAGHPVISAEDTWTAAGADRLVPRLRAHTLRDHLCDPQIDLLRHHRNVVRATQVDSLARRGAHAELETGEWRELAEVVDRENHILRSHVESLEGHLARVTAKLAALEYSARSRGVVSGTDLADTESDLQDFELYDLKSVSDAVKVADELYQSSLALIPAAFHSARESPFSKPLQVLQALSDIAEVATLRANNMLKVTLRDAFLARGQDYASGIAETSSRRIRAQHRFLHEGDEYNCVEHLRLGSGFDPRECLRIYFCMQPTCGGRVIVGHVGRHLETSVRRT